MPESLGIESLTVRGFRNLSELELLPGPRFNVVHGDNGAGKSNILEAIAYLGALRSFRGGRTEDLVQRGRDVAALSMRVAGGWTTARTFRVVLRRTAAREVSIDGKRPRSAAAYLASVQTVVFHPGDVDLAAGGAEPRRAFLDRVLEQMDPTYGAALAAYGRALRSRNRLLREDRFERRAVAAYDELLASSGAVVGQTRARLVDELAPLAQRAFDEVSGERGALRIIYEPRVEPVVDSLRKALERALDKDRARGFTADGPHADDLAVTIRDAIARRHASQGQHRAIALALKIAELDTLARRTQHVPVLLLDDVSSELDRSRNRRLFELLARQGGQVFLTTTHPEFILLEGDRVDFRVESGMVTRTP